MLSRESAIREVFNNHGDEAIYITNTGFLSRAISQIYPEKKNIFYMQGSMGLGPGIGLGIALNSKKEVVVMIGDGSFLMHMGLCHTIRDYSLSNLHVYIMDNGCHESVGEYKTSKLEKSYPGIKKIYKISNDGKRERVSIPLEENKKNILELLSKDE